MVVLFLNTKTIFAIFLGYEIGLCAMYSRQHPANRYFAKSWEPESRGRCAEQVAMDKFFNVPYERDQAGTRHHYLAVRWDHQFQGQWLSYAVSSVVITRAYTVSGIGCHQPTAHVVHRVIL
jgi:hypothetical protein